jgi:hypothetical protein
MGFYLVDSVVSKSRFFVSFDEFVDKVDTAQTPSAGEVLLSDFSLMGENFLSNLLSGFAHVRSLTLIKILPHRESFRRS